MQDPQFVDLVTTRYGKQLDHLFGFYGKQETVNLVSDPLLAGRLIQYKTLAMFTSQFKLVPDLVLSEDLSLIYNTIVRNKTAEKKPNVRYLDYNDFLEVLVRIAVVAKRELGAAGLPEEPNEESKVAPVPVTVKAFDLQGVDVPLIERLLQRMDLTPSDKVTALARHLKTLQQESVQALLNKPGPAGRE